jgi:hypothetical protein
VTFDEALEGASLTPRQWRLLACAAVRSLPWASRASIGKALDAAERFADGAATGHELASIRFGARSLSWHAGGVVCWPPEADPRLAAWRTVAWVIDQSFALVGGERGYDEFAADWKARNVGLVRDLVPGPGETGLARHRGDEVARLARVIYRERDWAAMPVLGDALEEAGCPLEWALRHCRDGGPHARGCHVLDALGAPLTS